MNEEEKDELKFLALWGLPLFALMLIIIALVVLGSLYLAGQWL